MPIRALHLLRSGEELRGNTMTEELVPEETWEDRVMKKVNEIGDLFEEKMPGSKLAMAMQLQAMLQLVLYKVPVATTSPIE
jgi:hypothetical protein